MIRNNKGISIIELILFIVIMGLAVPPLFIAAANMYEQSINLESLHIAANLAQGRVEALKSRSFNNIVEEPATGFAAPFNRFQYRVHVNYVNPSNLNLSVDPTVTDYKRVQVMVEDTAFLGREITFSTVVTND